MALIPKLLRPVDRFSAICPAIIPLSKVTLALRPLAVVTETGPPNCVRLVGKALEELNTETLFYKVKQKPGKPLYLGRNGATTIFGLPGNPGAALSCFYIYVSIALAQLTGKKSPFIVPKITQLSHDYSKPAGLTQFLKAKSTGDKVQILSHQSSAMLNAYTDTNCIARLEEKKTAWVEGDKVTIYQIP